MSCWALWHGSIYYEALPTPFPPTGPGFGCEFCRHLVFGRLVVARTPCLSLLMRTCLCFPPPSPATSWDPSSWGAPHPGTGVLLELRRGAWLQADGNACYKKDTAHTATRQKSTTDPAHLMLNNWFLDSMMVSRSIDNKNHDDGNIPFILTVSNGRMATCSRALQKTPRRLWWTSLSDP